jgi:SagB-type dehydrogenase family enzyme
MVVAGRNSHPAVSLPHPDRTGSVPVETTLSSRRSVREFTSSPITLAQLGQLLWAAQGVTQPPDFRASPSAGALYPLFVHVVANNVASLEAGVYRYRGESHALLRKREGDIRNALADAAAGQEWLSLAAAVIVIAADAGRTTGKYGRRGERYVLIEAGHAAQGICLQAVALGLGTTVVGAFRDAEVADLVALGRAEQPLCLIPVGRPGR